MTHEARFDGIAGRYADARPDYPPKLLRWIAAAILDPSSPADGLILDVGSGTGIFTRQLLAALPAGTSICGVEPSADMRRRAAASGAASIAYVDGAAERLPVAEGAARAVLAATAAHWFDRPAFLAEACRVLKPGGLLAIVEYVRDEEHSPAARAVVEFLARHGGARAYRRPDYEAELKAPAGLGALSYIGERVTLRLSPEAYASLALSSSHARAALENLGEDEARRLLGAEATRLAAPGGAVPFGYLFQCFAARRI